MRPFEIGDIVEITDDGRCYPTYEEKAIELKATNWKENYKNSNLNGLQGRIIAIDESGSICLICLTDRVEVLMSCEEDCLRVKLHYPSFRIGF